MDYYIEPLIMDHNTEVNFSEFYITELIQSLVNHIRWSFLRK